MDDYDVLRDEVRTFVAERDWGKFHDPKSLLLALMGELGELSELFRWLPAGLAASSASVEPLRSRVSEEFGDIMIYLLCLADSLGLDPVLSAREKLADSRRRFPADKHRGVAPVKE